MAKELTTEFRFVARTAPELYDAFKRLILTAAGKGLKFNGRKLGVEGAVNAIIVEFMELPEEARLATIVRGLPRFERLLAETDEERAEAEKQLAKVVAVTATPLGDTPRKASNPGGGLPNPGKEKKRG